MSSGKRNSSNEAKNKEYEAPWDGDSASKAHPDGLLRE